jgi:hypothetical protein
MIDAMIMGNTRSWQDRGDATPIESKVSPYEHLVFHDQKWLSYQ